MKSLKSKKAEVISTIHDANTSIAYNTELNRLIEVEAFEQASKDGFKKPPLEYWLSAERYVRKYF